MSHNRFPVELWVSALLEQLRDEESRFADRDGWVYFIRVGKGGPVKIGYTRHFDIEKRLAALQTGNPYKLQVVAVMRGCRDTEWMLHRQFSSGRLQGEWFRGNTRGLNEIIRQLAQSTLLEAAL